LATAIIRRANKVVWRLNAVFDDHIVTIEISPAIFLSSNVQDGDSDD